MTKEQFTERVLQAEKTMFHVAFSILHHEADCADAVQEAVLKAYASREKLRKDSFFNTWLIRILMNECYGILRSRSRQLPVVEQAMECREDERAYIKEEYLDLYRAIGQLKEKDRMCVLLFYMEDYTLSQIADILDIPEGTVKSRLNRARLRLRGMLEEPTEKAVQTVGKRKTCTVSGCGKEFV